MSEADEWSKPLHHNRYARKVEGAVRKRRSRLIESRLVSDFCAKYMGGYEVRLRCRVGPRYAGQLEKGRIDGEIEALGNWRYYADAVCIGSKDIILLEGAVRFRSDHVGKILGYSYLLAMTPEFIVFHDLPLRLLAMSAQFDALAQLMCSRFDIEMVKFSPPYAQEYLRSLEKRKQRSSRPLLPSIARHGERYAKEYRI